MSTVQRAVPKCIVLLVAWLALAGTASATTPVGQTSLDTLLHTCAIKPDGTPICWGKNSSRQATIPAGTGTVTAITVGFGHTCAIKADGSPTCWGDNSEGQTTVPAGISTVTDINAGTPPTCAIKTGGIPVCWGSNRPGRHRPRDRDQRGHATHVRDQDRLHAALLI